MWLCGDVAMWRCGFVAMWLCGNVALWRCAKAASFRTIITIAAIGVFMGAAMSNGMMDIARHGIFRPEYFHFYELICIFMAVMTIKRNHSDSRNGSYCHYPIQFSFLKRRQRGTRSLYAFIWL